MTELTQETIDAIRVSQIAGTRDRHARATGGSWQAVAFGPSDPITIQTIVPGFEGPIPIARVFQGLPGYRSARSEFDATFLAHSRDDVGRLLSEIDYLNDQLRTAQAVQDSIMTQVHRDYYRWILICVMVAGLALTLGVSVGRWLG